MGLYKGKAGETVTFENLSPAEMGRALFAALNQLALRLKQEPLTAYFLRDDGSEVAITGDSWPENFAAGVRERVRQTGPEPTYVPSWCNSPEDHEPSKAPLQAS